MARFLFTTLPTNDLGLLARSLPVAKVLVDRGHRIEFCCPARAPATLIADAGFDNLLPRHPLFDAIAHGPGFRGLIELLGSGDWKRSHSGWLTYAWDLLPVIMPTFSERESNARRVQALGAGLVVPVDTAGKKKHVNAEHLRNAVRTVLADKSFAQNASRVRKDLRRYAGAPLAADLIEEFSRHPRSGARA